MTSIALADAALFLGTTDDQLARWIAEGRLVITGVPGAETIDGMTVATFAQENAILPTDPSEVARSARNRFVGIVTGITMDKVMAQVELQCGVHRVVSLMSAEAVTDLGLELGAVAVAVVKATTVIVETPHGHQ